MGLLHEAVSGIEDFVFKGVEEYGSRAFRSSTMVVRSVHGLPVDYVSQQFWSSMRNHILPCGI